MRPSVVPGVSVDPQGSHSASAKLHSSPGAAPLPDRPDQLGLSHLGATVDPELCRLTTQFGDRHAAGPAASPLGVSALTGGHLCALSPERLPGLLRKVRDRPLPFRPPTGPS